MRRRAFLTALAIGSAGCLGRATPDDGEAADGEAADGESTDERTNAVETPTAGSDEPSVEPAEQGVPGSGPEAESSVETVRVGDGPPSGAQPHGLVVWRDGPVRPVIVEISSPDADIDVSRTTQLEPGEYLRFELTERVDYEITVFETGRTRYRFDLSSSMVDCNASTTTVRVPESGPVEYGTISTMMACQTVTVSTGDDETDGGS